MVGYEFSLIKQFVFTAFMGTMLASSAFSVGEEESPSQIVHPPHPLLQGRRKAKEAASALEKPACWENTTARLRVTESLLNNQNVSSRILNSLSYGDFKLMGKPYLNLLCNCIINQRHSPDLIECRANTIYKLSSAAQFYINQENPDDLNLLLKIIELYELSYQRGHILDTENISELCYNAAHLVKQDDLSETYLKKAISYGHKEAREKLEFFYSYIGKSEEEINKTILNLLLPLAEKGDLEAQQEVRMLYLTVNELENADKWFTCIQYKQFRFLADHNPEARYALGELYEKQGNLGEATECFQKIIAAVPITHNENLLKDYRCGVKCYDLYKKSFHNFLLQKAMSKFKKVAQFALEEMRKNPIREKEDEE